jgi:hypothetical protein
MSNNRLSQKLKLLGYGISIVLYYSNSITVGETQKTVAYRKDHGRIKRATKTVALGYKYGFLGFRNGF